MTQEEIKEVEKETYVRFKEYINWLGPNVVDIVFSPNTFTDSQVIMTNIDFDENHPISMCDINTNIINIFRNSAFKDDIDVNFVIVDFSLTSVYYKPMDSSFKPLRRLMVRYHYDKVPTLKTNINPLDRY